MEEQSANAGEKEKKTKSTTMRGWMILFIKKRLL